MASRSTLSSARAPGPSVIDHVVPIVGPRSTSGPRFSTPWHAADNDAIDNNARTIGAVSRVRSTTKVIEQNVLPLHAEILEHLHAGHQHRRRPAQVILDIFRRPVPREVVLEHHLMDETGIPGPVVL